ncbi:acyl carrier protein [Streptomyces sp. NPDC000594]|uniref:acyl carrier protein n=1 Tax=Streptomyces sp. NPDC000594 TaxID=3154261 RepID=UPI00332FD77D
MQKTNTVLPDRSWVIQVVEEILRSGPVAAEESFYTYGGTSLQAMRVCLRLEQRSGVAVDPGLLLASDTVGEFADSVLAGWDTQEDTR